MIVKKLRLQRGWSQEQLAELAGLSTRTIQRVEKGLGASLETINALSSVFEVPRNALSQAVNTSSMSESLSPTEVSTSSREAEPRKTKEKDEENMMTDLKLTLDEKKALEYVENLKGFYYHIAAFIVVITAMTALNIYTTPDYWWVLWIFSGWTIGVILHAIWVFDFLSLFGPDWEKRQVEKRLGRKL